MNVVVGRDDWISPKEFAANVGVSHSIEQEYGKEMMPAVSGATWTMMATWIWMTLEPISVAITLHFQKCRRQPRSPAPVLNGRALQEPR